MINIFIIILLLNFAYGDHSIDEHKSLEYAVRQYTKLSGTVKNHQYPNYGDLRSVEWHHTDRYAWESGFYPGILWYLYKYTGDVKWKHLAIEFTDGLYQNQYIKYTHDVGFMIMCSYGNGLEFTKNSTYIKVIENAAASLATRFNHKIGCTRSWDNNAHGHGEFLVIVDNMMNLELFFKAWELSGNKTYYDMAVSHANKTIHDHIRPNGSTYHVVAYNETTGAIKKKYTAQGYADWSCWSQGQSWAIAGFTIAYRYTKLNHFLMAAEHVSKYYIEHLPEDSIAYVDFDVPHDSKHHYIPRDSSSASIAASGLFELYTHTQNKKYLDTANKIMTSLSSPKYRADGNSAYHLPAILANGTVSWGFRPDVALSFGDYYYIKSLGYYLK